MIYGPSLIDLLRLLITGIFILPVLGFEEQGFMTPSFGLAMLLFMGFPFALAGHYDMYNYKTRRSDLYFPCQEQSVITVVAVLAIAYVITAIVG